MVSSTELNNEELIPIIGSRDNEYGWLSSRAPAIKLQQTFADHRRMTTCLRKKDEAASPTPPIDGSSVTASHFGKVSGMRLLKNDINELEQEFRALGLDNAGSQKALPFYATRNSANPASDQQLSHLDDSE